MVPPAVVVAAATRSASDSILRCREEERFRLQSATNPRLHRFLISGPDLRIDAGFSTETPSSVHRFLISRPDLRIAAAPSLLQLRTARLQRRRGVQAGTGCHEGGIILSKKPPEWRLSLPQQQSASDSNYRCCSEEQPACWNRCGTEEQPACSAVVGCRQGQDATKAAYS